MYRDTYFYGPRFGLGAIGEVLITPGGRLVAVGRAGWYRAVYTTMLASFGPEINPRISAGGFEAGIFLEFRFNRRDS